ncbi:putative transcription factor GRF family [Helianthus annuus]|nr:putative transcription factor GRF family [Helianthus annuus]
MSYCSNSASSANSKSKIFKIDLDGNVYCHHEIVAVVRMVRRNNQRKGQEFYGCSKWPRADCKFFLWKEDVKNLLKFNSNASLCLWNSSSNSHEELKIQNLELQNMLLIEENNKLRGQIGATECMWKKPFVLTLVFVIVIWCK